MAARQMLRRIVPLLAPATPRLPLRTSLLKNDPAWRSLPSANSIFYRGECYTRRLQTLAESSKQALGDVESHEGSCLKADSNSANVVSSPMNNGKTGVINNATSNLKSSSRHDLAMVFTCKVCETRSVKTMCRKSYDEGVVVVRCGGCDNLHLIADHLGWFGEPGKIEDLLAARGEEVKKGCVDTLNLTLEDLAGKK
ncbi:hypothetical protein RJ640_018270 [Escallonia rubra]|uniref:DNL-type domain-containing protein n=1 Tax=Escallonia rubra TaxID=112253 RepID=A0AA88UAP9_9ASTE|nr:hypothetical protein RJ640_018270 [Escallonia rubra]